MRTTTALALFGACVVGAVLLVPGPATAQVELDRIVARVNNRIITQQDVRQAKLLKLVDDPSSDDSTRRGLENRTLVLTEIARQAPLPPTSDAELAARRSAWESRGGTPALLSQAGMSDGDLQNWFRDDLRIEAYVKRQFGHLPENGREKAASDWLAGLRRRAGLD